MENQQNNTIVADTVKSFFANSPKIVATIAGVLSPEMTVACQSLLLSLDVATSVRQDRRLKRLENLMQNLASEIESLGNPHMDAEFFKSPEFLNLIEQSVTVCWKANSEESLQEAVRILKSTIKTEEIQIGASEYMQALSELSEAEVVLLKTLYRMQKDHVYTISTEDSTWYDKVRWKDLLKETGMKSSEHIHFMLNRIARTGFIIQNTPRTLDEVSHKSAAFRITGTLRILMQSLEKDAP